MWWCVCVVRVRESEKLMSFFLFQIVYNKVSSLLFIVDTSR